MMARAEMQMAAAPAPVPLEAGSTDVTVSVTGEAILDPSARARPLKRQRERRAQSPATPDVVGTRRDQSFAGAVAFCASSSAAAFIDRRRRPLSSASRP